MHDYVSYNCLCVLRHRILSRLSEHNLLLNITLLTLQSYTLRVVMKFTCDTMSTNFLPMLLILNAITGRYHGLKDGRHTSTTSPTVIGSKSQMDQSAVSTDPNGIGPFSDATFIAMLVVGGIVIIACLVCAVVCFSKYQKRELRKQWLRDRAERRRTSPRTVHKKYKRSVHTESEVTKPIPIPLTSPS